METITPYKKHIIKLIGNTISLFMKPEKKDFTSIDKDSIKSILIIDPMQIGDSVMLIPFLQSVRRNFKNSRISLLCTNAYKTVLKNTNLVDEFIVFEGEKAFQFPEKNNSYKKLKELLEKINKKHFDIAIETRGDIRFIFFMKNINADRKISFSYSGGTRFLTFPVKMPDNYKETHMVDDKNYLLEEIGCTINPLDKFPTLPITEEMVNIRKEIIANNNFENKKIIGFHPGARKEIRRYNNFDKILEKLYTKNKNLAFVIYEGVDEQIEVKKVVDAAKRVGAPYIVIKESLENYLKRVPVSDILICNDSSAAHIANAYKIPTFVMYGPVKPAGIRPYNNTTAYLNCVSIDLPCKPCYKADKCPKKSQECFEKISINNISKDILKIVKKLESSDDGL